MGRRLYSRQPSGRFRRATLENTFGLSAPVCPQCRRLNPHGVYEPEPVNCHACGARLRPESEYADRGETGNAIASLMQDLGLHPETESSCRIVAELMMPLAMIGEFERPGELRKFIEGFN